MTASRLSWRETLAAMFSGRILVALLMGFSSGLPLLLTGSVLQAWLKDGGVDLARIGLFALIGLPYTLKFLWAPLFDRYAPVVLGRRRGWLLLTQFALAGALLLLSTAQPTADQLWLVMLAGLLVSFFSASQDIVVDAYRRESMGEIELGLGSAMYVNGYRIGMLLAGGGGLILADLLSFETMYRIMAAVHGGLCDGDLVCTGAVFARGPAAYAAGGCCAAVPRLFFPPGRLADPRLHPALQAG